MIKGGLACLITCEIIDIERSDGEKVITWLVNKIKNKWNDPGLSEFSSSGNMLSWLGWDSETILDDWLTPNSESDQFAGRIG